MNGLLENHRDERAEDVSRPDLLALRRLCEDHLASRVSGSQSDVPQTLSDAMIHTLLAPSKRARGVLSMLAAASLGATPEKALSAAGALELMHAASLILDDLPSMDDAGLRRGRPANHVVFGEDTSILAAVGLINLAYREINDDMALAVEQRSRISLLLAEAVGPEGLTGGQFDDLRGASANTDVKHVESIHARKTARLFAAAAEIGAVIAGRPDAEAPLRDFGGSLGMAFQAFDDMLDARALPARIGKDAGKDAGKATVIHLLGPEAAAQRSEAHVARAFAALAPLSEDVQAALRAFTYDIVEGMQRRAAS